MKIKLKTKKQLEDFYAGHYLGDCEANIVPDMEKLLGKKIGVTTTRTYCNFPFRYHGWYIHNNVVDWSNYIKEFESL